MLSVFIIIFWDSFERAGGLKKHLAGFYILVLVLVLVCLCTDSLSSHDARGWEYIWFILPNVQASYPCRKSRTCYGGSQGEKVKLSMRK